MNNTFGAYNMLVLHNLTGSNITASNSVTASQLAGFTNNFSGYVTNGTLKPFYDTNSPASDVSFIVDVTNTAFSTWQTYSNSVILFTNYWSKPFAFTPKCVISPANGNFDHDVYEAVNSFTTIVGYPIPLQYLFDLSTSNYGVFGFNQDPAGAVNCSTKPWKFVIHVVQ